jgi:hypothetical protein
MVHTIGRTVAALALLIVVLAASGCGPNLIRLNAEPGAERLVEMSTTATMNMQVLGQNVENTQSQDMTLRLRVDSVNDDVYGFTATIEKLASQTAGSFAGMTFTEDQLPDELKDMQPKLSAAEGMAFTFEYHPDGTVKNVDGTDPILDAIVDSVENLRPFQRVAMRTQVANTLGVNDFEYMLADMVCVHPPSNVGVGDSWTESHRLSGGAVMTVEETYTLTERTGGVAVFEVIQKTSPELGSQSVPMPGGDSLGFRATGSGAGTMRSDPATGFTLEGNSSFSVEGAVSGLPGASGVELPVELKVSSRMESRPG